MTTRLLKTKMDEENVIDAPVIASGVMTSSTVVKATPGLLLGYTMEMTDAGGDGEVEIWDSFDTTTAGRVCVARIRVVATTDGEMASFCAPPASAGIECGFGIYMKVAAGDVSVVVYYK